MVTPAIRKARSIITRLESGGNVSSQDVQFLRQFKGQTSQQTKESLDQFAAKKKEVAARDKLGVREKQAQGIETGFTRAKPKVTIISRRSGGEVQITEEGARLRRQAVSSGVVGATAVQAGVKDIAFSPQVLSSLRSRTPQSQESEVGVKVFDTATVAPQVRRISKQIVTDTQAQQTSGGVSGVTQTRISKGDLAPKPGRDSLAAFERDFFKKDKPPTITTTIKTSGIEIPSRRATERQARVDILSDLLTQKFGTKEEAKVKDFETKLIKKIKKEELSPEQIATELLGFKEKQTERFKDITTESTKTFEKFFKTERALGVLKDVKKQKEKPLLERSKDIGTGLTDLLKAQSQTRTIVDDKTGKIKIVKKKEGLGDVGSRLLATVGTAAIPVVALTAKTTLPFIGLASGVTFVTKKGFDLIRTKEEKEAAKKFDLELKTAGIIAKQETARSGFASVTNIAPITLAEDLIPFSKRKERFADISKDVLKTFQQKDKQLETLSGVAVSQRTQALTSSTAGLVAAEFGGELTGQGLISSFLKGKSVKLKGGTFKDVFAITAPRVTTAAVAEASAGIVADRIATGEKFDIKRSLEIIGASAPTAGFAGGGISGLAAKGTAASTKAATLGLTAVRIIDFPGEIIADVGVALGKKALKSPFPAITKTKGGSAVFELVVPGGKVKETKLKTVKTKGIIGDVTGIKTPAELLSSIRGKQPNIKPITPTNVKSKSGGTITPSLVKTTTPLVTQTPTATSILSPAPTPTITPTISAVTVPSVIGTPSPTISPTITPSTTPTSILTLTPAPVPVAVGAVDRFGLPFFPLIPPGGGGGRGAPFLFKTRKRRKTKFLPSLVGVAKGIKQKRAPRILTGLEVRGILRPARKLKPAR